MVCRILIVEDEADLLDYYSSFFGEHYKVITASTGKDAIEQAKLQTGIDLAIVDFRLPDMLGTDVLREIRSINPSSQGIIITAYGDEDVAVQVFKCGASDYIKKPFSFSEMLAKIQAYFPATDARSTFQKSAYFSSVIKDGPLHEAAVPSNTFRKIRQAVTHIEDNYRTDISLGTAAKEANMSPSHFSREFKKVMGITYQEYVNQRRVIKAQNMLKNSILSITEIALSVGYADLTSFERIFKKTTGCTPTLYRDLPKSDFPR